MKKYILLFAILLASCEMPVEEPKGSGYWIAEDGNEKFVNASDDYTDIFKAWVEAHNEKDIDKVLTYETDDVILELPDGTSIEGKEAHSQGLENYFTLDPELNMYWALPYVGVNNAEVWIIAGSVEDTNTEEGKQSRLLMVDAQFTEDKLSRIIFYEKARPSSQN